MNKELIKDLDKARQEKIMIKLEIFDNPKAEIEPIRLALKAGKTPGTIKVCAVDSKGDILPCGNLVTFSANGRVRRHRGVSPKLGFDLDECNRVELYDF